MMGSNSVIEDEDERQLRDDVGKLNIRKKNRNNIVKGLDSGQISPDSAKRIINDINVVQSGIAPPPLGAAPPVSADDPNFANRTALRNIFNRNGVSDNAAAPANSESTFTAPLAPRDPDRLSAVARELNEPGSVDSSLSPAADLVANLSPGVNAPPTTTGGDSFGQDLLNNIPAAFPSTIKEAMNFDARDAAERSFNEAEGAEEIGSAIGDLASANVGRVARTTGGFIDDATRGPRNVLSAIGRFGKGFLGLGEGGPPTADAEELPEFGGGDRGQQAAQDEAVGNVEQVSGTTEPVSTTLVSDQPGAESTPLSGGTVADRILGPPVASRPEDRGPGIEVIRGLQRSFQPTDEAGETVGGEVPFGEGVLRRAMNIGMSRREATDFALSVSQQDAALVNAGANDLRARTSAVIPITGVFSEGAGETQGAITVQPDGSFELWDTGVAIPLAATISIIKEPATVIGPTGLPTSGTKELIISTTVGPDGQPINRRINEAETESDRALRTRFQGKFSQWLQEEIDAGANEADAFDRAMDRLRKAEAALGG